MYRGLIWLGRSCHAGVTPVSYPYMYVTTNYGHPEVVFFQKSETFGLEQTNWAEIFNAFGVFPVKLSALFWHCESLVHETMYLAPKYDIGSKTAEFCSLVKGFGNF